MVTVLWSKSLRPGGGWKRVGSALGLVLLNIFIKDLYSKTELALR